MKNNIIFLLVFAVFLGLAIYMVFSNIDLFLPFYFLGCIALVISYLVRKENGHNKS